MKVYLSGPITGVPDFEKNFARAERQLSNWGSTFGGEIVNPVKIGKKTEKKIKGRKPTWQEYMKDCIGELVTCDAIIMLPDWTNSKGAIEERRIAELLGLAVACINERGGVIYHYGFVETSEVCSREI